METIVGYSYKIYYDSTFVHESDDVFDTEEEAIDDASIWIDYRIDDWSSDGAWHPEKGDDEKLFDIVVVDVTEEIHD